MKEKKSIFDKTTKKFIYLINYQHFLLILTRNDSFRCQTDVQNWKNLILSTTSVQGKVKKSLGASSFWVCKLNWLGWAKNWDYDIFALQSYPNQWDLKQSNFDWQCLWDKCVKSKTDKTFGTVYLYKRQRMVEKVYRCSVIKPRNRLLKD